MVYKIPPGGEVNHIQPVAYLIYFSFSDIKHSSCVHTCMWSMRTLVERGAWPIRIARDCEKYDKGHKSHKLK